MGVAWHHELGAVKLPEVELEDVIAPELLVNTYRLSNKGVPVVSWDAATIDDDAPPVRMLPGTDEPASALAPRRHDGWCNGRRAERHGVARLA
jgi:hypothetical protein